MPGRRSRFLVALLVACTALLVAAASAWAMPPSPALLERAAHDPALAARVKAAEAANPDVPNVTLKLAPNALGVPTLKPAPAGAKAGEQALTFNACVILAKYSDTPTTVASSYFDDLYFGTGSGPATLRGYYRDASYWPSGPTAVDITGGGQTLVWVTLPQTRAYYSNRFATLCRDAITAAHNAGFNFAPFDNDHDGWVEALQVVHVGRGQEDSGDPLDIWSQAFNLATAPTYDGVSFSPVSIVPELVYDPYRAGGAGVVGQKVGVLAHELGHTFGLWDLYDYGYDSYGLGFWSIMAFGSWSGPHQIGESPSRFDAFSAYALGFVDVTDVSENLPPTGIPCVDTGPTDTVYRVRRGGAATGPEYHPVENRQQRGTDGSLPGNGLLIYHVDESAYGYYANDDQTHYAVGLQEAHGGVQNLRTAGANGNPGDMGDPWPGVFERRVFSDATDPNAHYYDDSASGIRVRDIGDATGTSLAITATLEITDMAGGIAINGGSLLTSATGVVVTNGVSGGPPTQMRFSTDGATFSVWEPFSGSKTMTLPAGDGAKTVWASFKDGNGATITCTDGILLDATPPTTTDDHVDFYDRSATVSLAATDGAGSGVASTAYRLDGGPWRGGSAVTTSAPGSHTLEFRSTDAAGNVEQTRSAGLTVLATSRVEQADPRLSFTGAWTTYANPAHSGGSWSWINAPGSVTARVTSGHVFLVAATSPSYGIASVSVDGGPPIDVDLYSPANGYRKVVGHLDVGAGAHDVTVSWTGRRNPLSHGTYIGLDALDLTGALAQAATPPTRFEQQDSRLVYGGPWTTYAAAALSGGSYAWTNSSGGKVTAAFTGTSVGWVTGTSPKSGIASVSIDGGPVEAVDLYTPGYAYQTRVWSRSGLEDEAHTLTIAWTGTRNPASGGTIVGLDALDVVGALTQAPPPTVRYEQAGSPIAFSGVWTTYSSPALSGGSYAWTNSFGGSATATFTGTSVTWVTVTSPKSGVAYVSIDGGPPVPVDLYSAGYAYRVPVWTSPTLPNSQHTVTIAWTGARNPASGGTIVGLDALDVAGLLTP